MPFLFVALPPGRLRLFDKAEGNKSTDDMAEAPKRQTKIRRMELGGHIVVDPRICHGKPTFKGTRILVQQVLNDVASGKSWEFISKVRWGGRVSVAAIAEAVALAQKAFLNQQGHLKPTPEGLPVAA